MILDLNPDVVIMFTSWPPMPDEVQEVLAPTGIKVVGLDFYMVEVWYKELTTLGYLLDTEERADEYIDFFQSWTDRIDEVVEDLEPEEKKTVYFEQEAKYYSYGGADYGCGIPGMVRAAGGIYIYDDVSEYGFEVDTEDLIERNPDVIYKGTGVGMNGYTLTDTSELEEVRDEIMNRPELAMVTAVENGEVYAISWGVAGGKGKIFGPVFLAKCLYPEKFEDLEPNDYMKEYLEEWQNLPYQGVYIHPYPE
jgi:iron complex transport system substrate-binding protein